MVKLFSSRLALLPFLLLASTLAGGCASVAPGFGSTVAGQFPGSRPSRPFGSSDDLGRDADAWYQRGYVSQDWETVMRVEQGTPLRVETEDGRVAVGRMLSADPDMLRVWQPRGAINIPSWAVDRVYATIGPAPRANQAVADTARVVGGASLLGMLLASGDRKAAETWGPFALAGLIGSWAVASVAEQAAPALARPRLIYVSPMAAGTIPETSASLEGEPRRRPAHPGRPWRPQAGRWSLTGIR